jgi:transposase
MTIAVLGIDLGKNSCSLVGLDASGRVVLRRQMRRETVLAFGAKLQACVVAMEACCGAHHMGRALVEQGHTVRLMSPEYVRPYVKAQKNDDRDAEAIAEAATRPTMRFVALKSEAQLDVQTLHRVRDQLVGERTALINQVRAILLERGHVVAQGRAKLAASLTALLDTEVGSSLTPRIRNLMAEVRERWHELDRRIAALDAEFAEQARTDENARRLTAIGDVATFARGRDLAAWLGLVPRQVTTGGKPRLVGITKRGSKYLRKTLIQGARAAMPTLRQGDTRLGQWLRGLLARAHANTAVVALAAKMARIVWALLRHGRVYEPTAVAA